MIKNGGHPGFSITRSGFDYIIQRLWQIALHCISDPRPSLHCSNSESIKGKSLKFLFWLIWWPRNRFGPRLLITQSRLNYNQLIVIWQLIVISLALDHNQWLITIKAGWCNLSTTNWLWSINWLAHDKIQSISQSIDHEELNQLHCAPTHNLRLIKPLALTNQNLIHNLILEKYIIFRNWTNLVAIEAFWCFGAVNIAVLVRIPKFVKSPWFYWNY